MSSADTSETRGRARLIGKLTTLSVRQARHRGLYGDGGGLFLQVSERGTKSWVFRFKKDGRLRVMGLGPVHTIGLAEARERARECRRLRLDGIDPIEVRRSRQVATRLEEARAMTFTECAAAYIVAHRAGWRNAKHAAQWSATLAAYVDPVLGNLAVQSVDIALVLRVLEPIWTTKPETASRVRGRIENVLDWATARGYRAGENPARWRGHLENLLPKRSKVRRVEHHAALPYPEIGPFMVELHQQEGIAARALEFTILTASRTGEVIEARWNEINIAEKLWVVPGARMKAGKEHRVPLSRRAMVIVNEMFAIRSGDYVFPGAKAGRALSNMAFLMLLRRMSRGDLTTHGFRSSFRDWAAEVTAFPAEVAEMALAHTVSSKVEAAYRRGDLLEKRRQLAEAWAAYVDSTAMSRKVVPIRGDAEIEQLAQRRDRV
jgi:integrase